MKAIQYISLFLMLAVVACSDDDRSLDFVNQIPPPTDLSIEVEVTQNNTGVVIFTPSGTSVAAFTVDFGDGSQAETVVLGQPISHVYSEGTFTATFTANNLSGATAQITQEVTLTFLPPENLAITIAGLDGNSFGIVVSATADFGSSFDVAFGDPANTTATFLAGESATFIYDVVGDYVITVIARNGGSGTAQGTENVTITNPILLPIDFEDTTLAYLIQGFEGADSEILDNPVSSGINTSTRVVRTIKTVGAQFFAGTFTETDLGIDFSASSSISIKTYSPKANIPVRIRIENADNSSGVELDVNTTVVDQWETLTYDFGTQLDPNVQYTRIVIFFEFDPLLSGDGTTYYFDDIQVAN